MEYLAKREGKCYDWEHRKKMEKQAGSPCFDMEVIMPNRTIETNLIEEDIKIEGSLRPQSLIDYIGQEKVKDNLKVYIEAAKQRGGRSGSCTVLWAARAWKNYPCRHYCQ